MKSKKKVTLSPEVEALFKQGDQVVKNLHKAMKDLKASKRSKES